MVVLSMQCVEINCILFEINCDKIYHFSVGTATRYCNTEGQWEEANVLGCTSVQFIELEKLVSIIITTKTKMYSGRIKTGLPPDLIL